MTEHIRETNGHRRRGHDFEDRSPDEIQRELDATRREMSDTLHAIERELSSGQLMSRAFEMFRSGPGRFSQNLSQTVVNNPVPVALIGIGLLWLAKAQPEGGVEVSSGEGIKDKVSSATGRARELKDRTSEKAHELKSRTSERAHELKARSSERVRRSIGTVQRTWNDNPMLLGLCAIAGGAVLAASIPTTQREREVIGPHRDRLVEGAKQTARSAVEGAKSGVQSGAGEGEVRAGDEPLTTELHPEGRTIR